jgi:hypothetical protein
MRLTGTILLMACFSVVFAQQPYRGIVVDSTSMLNISDAHITVKNTTRGVISNNVGSFLIYALPSDTLVITALGYKTIELPLLFEEDALMIMMSENIQMLSDITVRSTRLYPNTIANRTHTAPRTLDSFSAVTSPFTYFWRKEREKRRLARLVEEHNRTQVYTQVISDPDVKQIIIDAYDLTEARYYDLVVEFNQNHSSVQYFTDPDKIMEALHEFFNKSVGR